MQDAEYDTLDRIEEHHWWFVGFRDLLSRCLSIPRCSIGANSAVLDAGCGTGANLRFLNELLKPSYLGGFDSSQRAVNLARKKCPAADIYMSDICSPDLHVSSFDLVLCCDVIYVPGITACGAGLRALVDRMSPGGKLVLNVPAYQWLYSEHDQAVHTRERYVLSQIRKLLHWLDLECTLVSYRLCPLLPLIVAARLPSILWRRKIAQPRSDLTIPPAIVNKALTSLLQLENRLILRGLQMPCGSSIFAVGRKPLQ